MAFAIYDRSIITIITFALIILMIFVISTQAPREITCKITKTGISLGNTLYPYKTIKTFWIMYNPPEIKTLNFETTAYINNTIIVQLGNQDPVTVKLALSQYLLEDLNREESATDALARRLKIWYSKLQYAPVVQRIGLKLAELVIEVRFLAGAPWTSRERTRMSKI